jgi:hypothetical protein
MDWVKTYESFVNENYANREIEKFEDVVSLPKGSGIITSVNYDRDKKIITVDLLPNIGTFDLVGLLSAVEKRKSNLKKEYGGAKQIKMGSSVVNL